LFLKAQNGEAMISVNTFLEVCSGFTDYLSILREFYKSKVLLTLHLLEKAANRILAFLL